MSNNVRDIRESLRVIDHGWKAPQTRFGREGGAKSRFSSVSLDSVQQRRFITADVAPRTATDFNAYVEAGTQHVFPDQADVRRLFDGQSHTSIGQVGLGVYVEDDLVGIDCVRRDQGAFDDPVWNSLHEVAILEQARFSLFAVDYDKPAISPGRPRCLPFHPGRKVCPTSTS